MDERTLQIVLRARDEATKELQKVQTSVDRLTAGFKANFNQAGLMSAAVVGGMAAATKAAIDNAASYEQNRIAFESMLASADKARDLLSEVSEFARKTPFELPQVVEGTRRLLAYGFAQKQVIPTFRMLGDIASAVGTDKLPQLILAYGQVRAATKLTGMELRQFSETGVPLLGTLAEHFGKTEAEVQEMVSAGQVGFKDVEAALTTLTSQGGIFFEGMERQAGSFNGIMSNINDSFGRFVRQVIGISEQGDIREGSIFYYFKLGAERLLPIMDALAPKVAAVIETILANKEAVIAIAGAIGGLLVLAIGALIVAFGPALLIMAAFAAAGAFIAVGIYGLIQIWNDYKAVVIATLDAAKAKLDEFIAKVQSVVNAAREWFGQLPGFLAAALAEMAKQIASFNPVIRIGLELPNIANAFNGLKLKAREIGIPGFAEGTDYAPGGLAVVGEKGPELVQLPRGSRVFSNEESRSMSGGGPAVQIAQVVIRQESDIDVLARRLEYYRRTGGTQ